MGPVVCLFTRNMYACIAASSSWNDVVLANAGVKDELQFWLNNIHHFNGYSIIRSFTAHAVIYSDASSTGYGSYLVTIGEYEATGIWSFEGSLQSSTYRELQADFNSVKCYSNSSFKCIQE